MITTGTWRLVNGSTAIVAQVKSKGGRWFYRGSVLDKDGTHFLYVWDHEGLPANGGPGELMLMEKLS